ncbi:hypothetical protein PHYC_03418 [Phycisphaerales bacterium]|nr:hypothetical protein PHYC_03418 [Phycisphaerales bacterium]
MTQPAGQQISGEPGHPAGLLGQRVTFTGRFATLTRAEAERLVDRAAGRVVSGVAPRATMLVVGMRGWPLIDSGRVTRKIEEAERVRASGKPIRIVSETQFREMLGLDPPAKSETKALDAEQVCAALGIDRRTLERWEHCGLVRPHAGKYDFQDLVSLRTVAGLVAKSVSPVVIRKSLEALGGLLPGIDRPLAQLNILVSDKGELVAEVEEALLTQTGQLEMRFDPPAVGDAAAPFTLVPGETRDSAGWIEAGIEHEAVGDLVEAESAYRRAAALAPDDPIPPFNLGNVLLAAGKLEAAAERFAQAAALDPRHAQAWFNLAHVQDELRDGRSAMRYLRRAIAVNPAFADAYFNLAELAERLGDKETAASAWDDYLRLDPASEWSALARRKLGALRGLAWA